MLVADADEPGRAQVSDPLGAFDSDSGLFKTFWPNYIHRPEQEAMAERLAEAEFQLRYGSPDQAAALVAMVMEQMIDMAGAE